MYYSLDKIKIECKVDRVRLQSFYDKRSMHPKFHVVDGKYFTSLNTYAYSFIVYPKEEGAVQEGAFACFFGWNGSFINQSIDPERCLLEFNPNKIDEGLWQDFLYCVQPSFKEIKAIDIAFDFECPRHYVFLNKVNNKWMCIGHGANYTEYLNPDKRHGRLKIYDKSLERGTEGPLTRVEVSVTRGLPLPLALKKEKSSKVNKITIEELEVISKTLERVYVADELDKLSPIARLLLLSDCNEQQLFLSSLERHTRSKYIGELKSVLSQFEISAFELQVLIEGLVRDVLC